MAIEVKTQGCPETFDSSAVIDADYCHVRECLVWEDGDNADKVVEIPTAHVDGAPYPLDFCLELTVQTSGDYADCATPELPEAKIVLGLME